MGKIGKSRHNAVTRDVEERRRLTKKCLTEGMAYLSGRSSRAGVGGVLWLSRL